jgi:membrane-associated phospholipid phosphatase
MKRALRYWIPAVAVLAVGGWLVCPDGQCRTTSLDRVGLGLAHALGGETIDRFMAGATWLGSIWLLLPLCGLAGIGLWYWGKRRRAVFLLLSLLGATAMAQVFKFWIARPRPDLFPVVSPIPLDGSYPSAHTMQAVAAAVAFTLLARPHRVWLAPVLLGLAGLVAWSRVQLQVHFPTDVLAGALAAALWVAGLNAWLRPAGDGRKGG